MSFGQNLGGIPFNLGPQYPDSKIKYIKTAVNKYISYIEIVYVPSWKVNVQMNSSGMQIQATGQ